MGCQGIHGSFILVGYLKALPKPPTLCPTDGSEEHPDHGKRLLKAVVELSSEQV
jgi:hypothetical protein